MYQNRTAYKNYEKNSLQERDTRILYKKRVNVPQVDIRAIERFSRMDYSDRRDTHLILGAVPNRAMADRT